MKAQTDPGLGASRAVEPSSVPTVASAPPFPPAPVEPPFAATAKPGDGQWVNAGQAGDRAFASGVLMRTVLHPHPAADFVSVDIVAVNLNATDIRFVLGTKDVEGKKVGPEVPVGLVPSADQASLLAVFNGGFQEQHGHFAMGVAGGIVGKPREDACTLVSDSPGSFRLGTWSRLSVTPESVRYFRQTPPCLVEAGELHPLLLKGKFKPWAGHNPEIVTRRRSAVGLDASNNVLFYAVGVEADPLHLARALKAVGAFSAAELDINWAWTKWLFFRDKEAGVLAIGSALREEMVHGKSTYVRLPSDRDFFYVVSH
ncbi:MAG: hypothetical protein SFV15_23205 [Polyangiaceae bacterium]|nr:hypothetical protein [Polyangiaceae bacterium]